jgi:diaminopimelate epimerase
VDGLQVEVTPVSMGNPHCVLFVGNVAEAPVEALGRTLVAHPVFPEGANVGFCQVVDPGFVRLRVFERGVGETRACGTGACAAVVAAQLRGAVGQRVKVSLPGGKVRIAWQGPGTPVRMSGPATLVFEGRIEA